MEQPQGWTWQDRAEGSIRRGTALDPSTEPVDGIRAFPTAYLPERLLITRALDEQEAYDRELRALRMPPTPSAGGWSWSRRSGRSGTASSCRASRVSCGRA